MKPLLIVMLMAALSSACMPLYGIAPPAPRPYVRPVDNVPATAAVTGRWDNVMMLPKNARVHVLRMDGVQAEGQVVSASATTLTLLVAAGEVEMAAEEVARVDRVGGSHKLRAGLSGAAHGAGAVGLLGLLTGHAPPARLFAAGAIGGAEARIHGVPAGARTVYLAPQVRR